MNGDGKLDLVVSGFGGVSVLLGDGFGGFSAAIPTTLHQNSVSVSGRRI